MKYTVVKDRIKLMNELERRYGVIDEIEDVIIGKKDRLSYRTSDGNEIMFIYIQDYMNGEKCNESGYTVVLSDINIDEYIFFELMKDCDRDIEVLVTNQVGRLFLEFFNAKMRYKIGCKKR